MVEQPALSLEELTQTITESRGEQQVRNKDSQEATSTTVGGASGWESSTTTGDSPVEWSSTPSVVGEQVDTQEELQPVRLVDAFNLPVQNPDQQPNSSPIDVSAEFQQQIPAFQNAVLEQLDLSNQASWDVQNAEQLLIYIFTNQGARDQIKQHYPDFYLQITQLEQAIERNKEQAQLALQNELLNLEAVKQALNLPEDFDVNQISTESIDASQIIENPETNDIVEVINNGEGVIETQFGKRGFTQTAVMVALFAYSVTQGGESLRIISGGINEWLMIKLGVDPEKAHSLIAGSNTHDNVLFSFNERELNEFFERRLKFNDKNQIVMFLTGLSNENRIKLLTGERVSGGILGNSHQLKEPLLGKIIATLKPEDIARLGLKNVAAQRQAQTT